jgi:hypothetical protein
MKRLWHLIIAMAAIAFFSQLRSWTTPALTLPPTAADWKREAQDCAKGARHTCTATYAGSPEITLTIYDMPGWPGPTAFGSFQEWQAQPGKVAFNKGRYFGIVEAPDGNAEAVHRFIAAIESTLPPGPEGHW